MKKISFVLVSLVIFGITAVCSAQEVSKQKDTTETETITPSVSRVTIFDSHLKCDTGEEVAVAKQPVDIDEKANIKVYESLSGALVFVFAGDKVYCCPFLGKGVTSDDYMGFVYGMRKDVFPWRKVLLYKIKTGAYIDVFGKEVLYRISEDGKPLVVSKKQPKIPRSDPSYFGEQFSVLPGSKIDKGTSTANKRGGVQTTAVSSESIEAMIGERSKVLEKIMSETRPSETEECSKEVFCEGNCEAYHKGFCFDKVSGKCGDCGASGCSCTFPFKNMEKCQEKCEEKN